MRRSIAELGVVLALGTGSAWAFPVTTCGTLIPARDTGTLVADLNCTDPSTPAVRLGNGATLELAGFIIQGISAEPFVSHVVVACEEKRCTIVGPGDIVGNDGTGAYGACVGGPFPGTLRMTSYGVSEIGVSNCSIGVLADKAKLTDVSAQGTVVGIQGDRLRLQKIDASSNDFAGIVGHRVAAVDVDANGNQGYGILGIGSPNTVRVRDLVAMGNGDAGVLAESLSVRSGDVTGNNGYGQGIDVAAARVLRGSDLVCGKSGRVAGPYLTPPPPALLAGSWGVCSGD